MIINSSHNEALIAAHQPLPSSRKYENPFEYVSVGYQGCSSSPKSNWQYNFSLVSQQMVFRNIFRIAIAMLALVA
jgi:hypothetical protein